MTTCEYCDKSAAKLEHLSARLETAAAEKQKYYKGLADTIRNAHDLMRLGQEETHRLTDKLTRAEKALKVAGGALRIVNDHPEATEIMVRVCTKALAEIQAVKGEAGG